MGPQNGEIQLIFQSPFVGFHVSEMYSFHACPSPRNEIASLMTKYAGREHTLYLKVCQKYKVQPKHEIKAAGGKNGFHWQFF